MVASLLVAVVLGSGCQKSVESTGRAVQPVSDEFRVEFYRAVTEMLVFVITVSWKR